MLFSLGIVVSFKGGEYMWKKHFENHPEEYENIRKLKEYSKSVDDFYEELKKEKLKKIEECRRILNEQSTR